MGGYGFLEEYFLAGAYRDDRINPIWEGTNEINRQIISGFMMKKALMEELPIREAIREISDFMSNGQLKLKDDTLAEECHSIETAKRFALYLFNEALCKYGQDLKHEQQLTEIIADIFMDIYTACLLYTSDAADDMQCVDLGGRRIICYIRPIITR